MHSLKSLIVEDEFTCRSLLLGYLRHYGHVDVAIDANEAIEAVSQALEQGHGYDLICLDIMLPDRSGKDVLKAIRQEEESYDIPIGRGAKIIMTTAVDDSKTIMDAFKGNCEAYLVKPIAKVKLIEQLRKLELIDD